MSYYNLDTYCDCLNIEVPECFDYYIFQVSYTDTTGNVVLKDKNNKVFIQEVSTDADGYFTLDASLLPEYFFNSYSKIKIEFQIDASTFDYFQSSKGFFSCLYLNFHDVTYTNTDREDIHAANQDIFVCCCAKKEIKCDEL